MTPSCLTASGHANFGFVSKYKKGSNIPEGQTEFQFQSGDLNFHSSAYDLGSLVVSGYKAQYKGTGDINGVPGYRFVLTAYDGSQPGGGNVDKFRMKITLGGTAGTEMAVLGTTLIKDLLLHTHTLVPGATSPPVNLLGNYLSSKTKLAG